MRLFFAVPFGEETLDRLCAAQELLRARANRGRFSPRENLHLTLAFLGELPPSRLDALDRAVKSIPFPPFEAKFDRLGCFRRPGGSIWWAGLRPTPQLLAIQRSLSDALQAGGRNWSTPPAPLPGRWNPTTSFPMVCRRSGSRRRSDPSC